MSLACCMTVSSSDRVTTPPSAGDGSEELVPAKGYLKPGDVIECEMEKIGVLRNVVASA